VLSRLKKTGQPCTSLFHTLKKNHVFAKDFLQSVSRNIVSTLVGVPVKISNPFSISKMIIKF